MRLTYDLINQLERCTTVPYHHWVINVQMLHFLDLAAHMRCGTMVVDDQDQIIFYLHEMGKASRRYHREFKFILTTFYYCFSIEWE